MTTTVRSILEPVSNDERLALGAQRIEIRQTMSDVSASAHFDALQAKDNEKKLRDRDTLVASFKFYEGHNLVLSAKTRDGKEHRLDFPTSVAKFNHVWEQAVMERRDARFWASASSPLILSLADLPGKEWVEKVAGTMFGEHDSSMKAARTTANHPTAEQDVLIEGQLDSQIELLPGEEIRFAIKDNDRPNATAFHSDWYSAECLLESAEKNVEMRSKFVDFVSRSVEDADDDATTYLPDMSVPLNSGITFNFLPDGREAAEKFADNEPILFKHRGHAQLCNFGLVKGANCPALLWVSVAFHFTPPA